MAEKEYIDLDEKITVTDTRGRERETTVRHILDINSGVYTAANVHPVVLCKDCENWDTDWIPKYARENEHFCPIVGLTTREDWFCADGEKKDG